MACPRLVIKKGIFVFCLAAIFALLPVSGYSGYITMDIETTITASTEKVEVKITAQNNGDEPAYKVYPELQLGSEVAKLSAERRIAVKASRQWTYAFVPGKAGLKLHGTYPLLVTLHYHDSNMYPYSMPQVGLFDLVKAGEELPFASKLETTDVLESGQISLTLGNTLDRTLAGHIRVILPDELTTVSNPTTFELQAKQTSQVLFPVTNKGALTGSRYKVFAIMEFDESGSHYSVLSSGMISVKDLKEKDSGRSLMIGGGSFIVMLFLLTVFLELRRRED